MANRPKKQHPTWTDVKAKLTDFDRAGLLDLIHDLYKANKDNQTFLHTRFGLGEDLLKPYRKTIARWLAPDVLSNQQISVSKAKQAIADYKKAIGDPQGLAELMVFFCEEAADFCRQYGNDDVPYFNALVRIFEQALEVAITLPADARNGFVERLEQVAAISHNFGYGVGDDMDDLLAQDAN